MMIRKPHKLLVLMIFLLVILSGIAFFVIKPRMENCQRCVEKCNAYEKANPFKVYLGSPYCEELGRRCLFDFSNYKPEENCKGFLYEFEE